MLINKFNQSQSVATVLIVVFTALIYVFSFFIVTISSFAKSETNNNRANQTIENNGQSPNKSYENIQQGSSQTGKALKVMIVMVALR